MSPALRTALTVALAALLLAGCGKAPSDLPGAEPVVGGEWQNPEAGRFIQAGDLAVSTIGTPDDEDSLDVMAVDESGEIVWRSSVPALPEMTRVVTYETHRPKLFATAQAVVLAHHLERSGQRYPALSAFDARTGAHLWTDREQAAGVLHLTDRHLITAGIGDEHPYVVRDVTTGRQRYEPAPGSTSFDEMLAIASGDRAYLAGSDDEGQYVRVVDLTTGRDAWRQRVGPASDALVLGTTIAAATPDRVLLQVRAEDGDHVELRRADTGRLITRTALAASSAAVMDESSGVAVLFGGGVDPQEPSEEDGMAAVDMATGELLWEISAAEAQRGWISLEAAAAGRLWVERRTRFTVSDIRTEPEPSDQEVDVTPSGDVLFGRIHSPLDGPPELVQGLG